MIYRYDELTWPEMNEAIRQKRVPILPVGSIEQHGHHLPLKVDWFCANSVCEEAAKRCPEKIILMPPVHYGYCPHVMDFPGTIAIHWEHMIDFCLDITKSLAYHGFKKIIVVNGHGSNRHLMEVVARRTVLETDAVCAVTNWWDMLRVDPDFNKKWRTSEFPGGCGHACELETSMFLHRDPSGVRKDKIADTMGKQSPFTWVDLFAEGPVTIPGYHSQGTETGVGGRPSMATAEKGRIAFEEAVKRLVEFTTLFQAGEIAASRFKPRVDHHPSPPTIPTPG